MKTCQTVVGLLETWVLSYILEGLLETYHHVIGVIALQKDENCVRPPRNLNTLLHSSSRPPRDENTC
jgi:hypothetical protein